MPNIIKGYSITLDDNVFNPETPKLMNALTEENESAAETAAEHCSRLIHKATADADAIIKAAKSEATKIKTEAMLAAEREINEKLEEGKKTGYSEGYAKGVNEAEALKKKAKVELDSAVAERKRMQNQLEPEIFDLIINILTKIFGEGNIINPQIIMYLIHQGLNETTITGNVSIRVSEADYQTVLSNKDSIAVDGTIDLEIVKDISLKESDCIIQTQFGSIDASLGQQFESLRNNLKFIFDNR